MLSDTLGAATMRAMPLQFLTWGTITAAIGSAAWLSSIDQAAVFCSAGYRATSNALGLDIPSEPTSAGSSAKRGPSGAAKPQMQATAG